MIPVAPGRCPVSSGRGGRSRRRPKAFRPQSTIGVTMPPLIRIVSRMSCTASAVSTPRSTSTRSSSPAGRQGIFGSPISRCWLRRLRCSTWRRISCTPRVSIISSSPHFPGLGRKIHWHPTRRRPLRASRPTTAVTLGKNHVFLHAATEICIHPQNLEFCSANFNKVPRGAVFAGAFANRSCQETHRCAHSAMSSVGHTATKLLLLGKANGCGCFSATARTAIEAEPTGEL